MKNIVCELLKIFLNRYKGINILIIGGILTIGLFGYQIFSSLSSLSQDLKNYQMYIEEFSGKLSDSKIEKIEKLNKEFQNDRYLKLVTQYQSGELNDDEYIDKQNELSEVSKKAVGFSYFYKQYQKVKSNPDLEICNSEITNFHSMDKFDYFQLFICMYMIYVIFLKDYDDKTIIYDSITSCGRKHCYTSKILIFMIAIATYIIVVNMIKVLIISRFISLEVSIHNMNWVGSNTINLNLWQFYLITTFLLVIGNFLLLVIALSLNMFIKKSSLILLVVFMLCYISKGFFGNNSLLLYFPFVSFLIPGKYFTSLGENLNAFDFKVLLIIMIVSIIFIVITIAVHKKSKRIIMLVFCLMFLSGCTSENILIEETYNSYQNISFSETDNYLYTNEKLMDKNNLKMYTMYRDPLYVSDSLTNITVYDNHIIYTSDDGEEKDIFNLDLYSMKTTKIANYNSNKQNYLDIENEFRDNILDDATVRILGNKQNLIYVYNDRVADKDGNVIIKGDFSDVISLYDNHLYSLQKNNQIIKYSLATKKSEVVDSVLCDYFFINDGKIYCHSIKNQKIYMQKELLYDEPVDYFDIYENTIYYDNESGVYSYDLITGTLNQLSQDTSYSIKVSNEGKYLYYTSVEKKDDNLLLNVFDLAKGKIVKTING